MRLPDYELACSSVAKAILVGVQLTGYNKRHDRGRGTGNSW